MAKLDLKNITKKFGKLVVIDDVSLEVKDGEFLVLVGPSGCGKSTLLNIIAGLETISSGKIFIGDKLVNDFEPKERDIAMVFQSYALYPNLDVKENISFGLKNRKTDPDIIEKRVMSVAKQLQIDHLLDRKPSQLSGGQRQRVAMGRAIARDPAIYLFDEPLSNLDAKLRVEMRLEIKLLHQRVKNTIVYVTHDQTEAMTLADRIALLNRGKIEQLADPMTLYHDPVSIFAATFIGSPSMNLIPATLEEHNNDVIFRLVNSLNTEFIIKVPSQSKSKAMGHLGKEVIIGMRPELLSQPKNKSAHNIIEAQQTIAEPTGSDLYFSFKLNNTNTIGRFDPEFSIPKDGNIQLQFNTDRMVAFDSKTGLRIF